MTLDQLAVQVVVREGVLWVGGEAYPLRNISHVGQRTLEVNQGAVWKKFIVRSIVWLLFGGIFASVAGTGGVLVLIAVEALFVWRLVAALSRPPLYGLVLNTAGTQRHAVWSTSLREIQDLVFEITRAIGHPETANVIYNLTHAVNGDIINQYGAGSIGKAQHGGSGNIVAS
ncbi:DUF6232 family protein [Streptomyces sp. NPDC090306]|uniref:DUF6232 family protein n=1 Tax=Streptomyces sp. NPDC090306 TaxID=3365961 RepID=UPI00381DD63F